MLNVLLERFPGADRHHLEALAGAWTIEMEQVFEQLAALCLDRSPPPEARHEVVFEMAKLRMWLTDRIIKWKTARASIGEISVAEEVRLLESPETKTRIANTARVIAERIWGKLVDGWWQRFPLILPRSGKHRRGLGAGGVHQGVKCQHFSPDFANREWANAQGRVRVYSRTVEGNVVHRDQGVKSWGATEWLYSQQLERWFSLVEGDAKGPYDKLRDMIPLSDLEVRQWIAFLACQMLRTPAYIERHLPAMKRLIAVRFGGYPTDIASLRCAYETMFTNNDLFAAMYRLIVDREWVMWTAPDSMSFIRSDDPVVVQGATRAGTWTLLYPMSPRHCFVVGPRCGSAHTPMFADFRPLDVQHAAAANAAIARGATRSVIGTIPVHVGADDALRVLLGDQLGVAQGALRQQRGVELPPYWGPLG